MLRISATTRRARVLTALLAAATVAVLPASPAAAAPETPVFGSQIEALAPYQGQTACDPVERPGVVRFRDLVLAAYPGTGDSGIARRCSVGGTSEHKEGRAWDWRVSTSDPVQVEQVDDLMAWLLAPDEFGNVAAMARRTGVMYIIWDSRVWKSYQAAKGWQPYSGASPHTDHVHLSFSWAGALAETSFWSGRVAPVMTRPVPPADLVESATPTVGIDSATPTGGVPPVVDPRAMVERRKRLMKSLPGPWRRH